MILNIIEPNACNSMCMRKPTQVKIQEYLQEEVKRKGLPPIDFNFPFNTWLNQIPDKYKIKISKDTRILSACYGEEKELKDEKRNFAGTLLEKNQKGLIGIDGNWCILPEFELIVDDDETVIINLCSEGRHHDMVDIFTANDVFWIVGKDGFICQFGDEPWGCPEGSDEINPVLFEIYNVVVKHN